MSHLKARKQHKGYIVVKRALDVLGALVLSFPSLCIITLCYIAIKLETKGPAFFVQERPGKHGKIFKIYKLRTMIIETERDGVKLTDMERITKAGRIVRKFSFDELPQILNIWKGEMSFIGPRPLMVEYLLLYTKEQARRHDVLPGISGWAQVNGRNGLKWNQKFKLDVWYVDHVCFKLDVVIFFRTVMNVLKQRGINASAGETMQLFKGGKEVTSI